MNTTAVPMADSRDMYVIHSAFRREFPAAVSLVRAVPEHDVAAATRVADHLQLIVSVLTHHHQGEDDLVWPKVLQRGATDAAPLVAIMESQHEELHTALDHVRACTEVWRRSAALPSREALAAALEAMLAPMMEHLDTEEEHLLPLIDRHLTAQEWAEVGAKGMSKTPKSQLPMIFGMVLRDGQAEHIASLRSVIPAPVWFVMSRLGPRAYDRHMRRLAH